MLFNLFHQQKEALELLGGFSTVAFSLSSKLSSISTFMDAFEGKMAVGHISFKHVPPTDISFDYWNNHLMSI